MSKIVVFISCIFIIFGCKNTDSEYELSIKKWHQLRIDSLKGETGFINLAGLYWLEQGVNSFGSASSNNLNFTNKSPAKLGSFLLRDSLVYLVPQGEIAINGKLVTDTTLIFKQGEVVNMTYKSLFWFIIKRGDRMGVRLRDFEHPLLSKFDLIDYFKTDKDWKFKAIWKPYREPRYIQFSNVLGMSITHPVLGAFYFTIKGKEYNLEPQGEPDSDGYFIMFYDKTSGHTTYGSGRFIYVAEPDSLGNSFIDFNKAFNPPCAFTEFATCLFPQKNNRLPIFVKAGEKFSGH